MKLCILYFSLLLPAFAIATETPFRIVIISDQAAGSRAEEFRTYLRRSVSPFNRMKDQDLSIEVRVLSAEENQLNCAADPAITRLVMCDAAFVQGIAGNALPVVITSVPHNPDEPGGSGGAIAVATTNLPFPTVVHEMLHVAGAADEYKYAPGEETEAYCTTLLSAGNFAYFKPQPPYASDPVARTTHAEDVLWMPRILPSTLISISPNSLGTPTLAVGTSDQRIGLFRGGPCPPDSEGRESWRPYENSTMRSLGVEGVQPIYEQIFVDYTRRLSGRDIPLTARSPEEVARFATSEIVISSENTPTEVAAPGTTVKSE